MRPLYDELRNLCHEVVAHVRSGDNRYIAKLGPLDLTPSSFHSDLRRYYTISLRSIGFIFTSIGVCLCLSAFYPGGNYSLQESIILLIPTAAITSALIWASQKIMKERRSHYLVQCAYMTLLQANGKAVPGEVTLSVSAKGLKFVDIQIVARGAKESYRFLVIKDNGLPRHEAFDSFWGSPDGYRVASFSTNVIMDEMRVGAYFEIGTCRYWCFSDKRFLDLLRSFVPPRMEVDVR